MIPKFTHARLEKFWDCLESHSQIISFSWWVTGQQQRDQTQGAFAREPRGILIAGSKPEFVNRHPYLREEHFRLEPLAAGFSWLELQCFTLEIFQRREFTVQCIAVAWWQTVIVTNQTHEACVHRMKFQMQRQKPRHKR